MSLCSRMNANFPGVPARGHNNTESTRNSLKWKENKKVKVRVQNLFYLYTDTAVASHTPVPKGTVLTSCGISLPSRVTCNWKIPGAYTVILRTHPLYCFMAQAHTQASLSARSTRCTVPRQNSVGLFSVTACWRRVPRIPIGYKPHKTNVGVERATTNSLSRSIPSQTCRWNEEFSKIILHFFVVPAGPPPVSLV